MFFLFLKISKFRKNLHENRIHAGLTAVYTLAYLVKMPSISFLFRYQKTSNIWQQLAPILTNPMIADIS